MDRFENKLIKGIHTSRYIASWYKVGGTMKKYVNKTDPNKRRIESHFADWLRTLVINGEHLTREEIDHICRLAENGKLELQESAKKFLDNM